MLDLIQLAWAAWLPLNLCTRLTSYVHIYCEAAADDLLRAISSGMPKVDAATRACCTIGMSPRVCRQ